MTAQSLADTTRLANGVTMPWLGLGVFKMPEGETTRDSVDFALRAGYHLVDTASYYGNETGVGEGIRKSGVNPQSVFVTTKVWNSEQGYDATLKAFEQSRRRLGLEILDLYLIHWPVAGKYRETWRAMETLLDEGRVRAIGVCNFHSRHLDDLLQTARVAPMVNQVECHPLLSQEPLSRYCRQQGIRVEAWAPLIRGKLDLPDVADIAQRRGKTPAQVVLRWHLQHDRVVIPKSVHPERIRENADVFDFALSTEEMARIDALNQDRRFGPDPERFNF